MITLVFLYMKFLDNISARNILFASEFRESCVLYRFEHADESGDGILDMEDNFMGTVWQNVVPRYAAFQYAISL